jgi:hypothetical protein
MADAEERQNRIVERRVTYILEVDDRLLMIEDVPARVNLDTGERLFAPQTVEQIQRMIREGRTPVRVIETPVYQFAEA